MIVSMLWMNVLPTLKGPSLVQVSELTARKTTTRTTGSKAREGNGKCYEAEEFSF